LYLFIITLTRVIYYYLLLCTALLLQLFFCKLKHNSLLFYQKIIFYLVIKIINIVITIFKNCKIIQCWSKGYRNTFLKFVFDLFFKKINFRVVWQECDRSNRLVGLFSRSKSHRKSIGESLLEDCKSLGKHFRSFHELKLAITKEWQALSIDPLRKLVTSMQNRVGEAIFRH